MYKLSYFTSFANCSIYSEVTVCAQLIYKSNENRPMQWVPNGMFKLATLKHMHLTSEWNVDLLRSAPGPRETSVIDFCQLWSRPRKLERVQDEARQTCASSYCNWIRYFKLYEWNLIWAYLFHKHLFAFSHLYDISDWLYICYISPAYNIFYNRSISYLIRPCV